MVSRMEVTKKILLEGGWCLTINRGIGNVSKKRGMTREKKNRGGEGCERQRNYEPKNL